MAPNRVDDDRVDDDRVDDLSPAEAARDRRRDHDAGTAARAGMRTGLAKQFKQILDAQAKRARAAGRRGPDEGQVDDEAGAEPAPKKRGHWARRPPPSA